MMKGFYQSGLSEMAKLIPYEIEIMSQFDAVSCISFDELFFCQKLLPQIPFYHLPHPLPIKPQPVRDKDIDLLFLGFENPHNKEGVKWFIDKVLPHVGKDIRITICGLVWSSLAQSDPEYIRRAEAAGVSHIDFAEDLDELYARTRVSMCPLLGGTGMKIKVIDSLARGIPVVTTLWGVDGFADKHNNGCLVHDDPVEFADAINRLVRNDELYNHTVETARAYFREYLSLEANQEKLNRIFDL
jgi:glycosyltransferase involved in cell wall biosynthesis